MRVILVRAPLVQLKSVANVVEVEPWNVRADLVMLLVVSLVLVQLVVAVAYQMVKVKVKVKTVTPVVMNVLRL